MTVLDGRGIVEKKMVLFNEAHPLDIETQVQPNGVDLRLDRVRYIQGRAELPRDGRIKTDALQMTEIPCKEGWFDLDHTNGVYLVDFLEKVSVQDGYCAIIHTRSSLVRVGVEALCGLWDTGFEGRLGSTLRVKNPLRVEWGAKIAQVMFLKSVFSGHRYTGNYQGTSHSTIK